MLAFVAFDHLTTYREHGVTRRAAGVQVVSGPAPVQGPAAQRGGRLGSRLGCLDRPGLRGDLLPPPPPSPRLHPPHTEVEALSPLCAEECGPLPRLARPSSSLCFRLSLSLLASRRDEFSISPAHCFPSPLPTGTATAATAPAEARQPTLRQLSLADCRLRHRPRPGGGVPRPPPGHGAAPATRPPPRTPPPPRATSRVRPGPAGVVQHKAGVRVEPCAPAAVGPAGEPVPRGDGPRRGGTPRPHLRHPRAHPHRSGGGGGGCGGGRRAGRGRGGGRDAGCGPSSSSGGRGGNHEGGE